MVIFCLICEKRYYQNVAVRVLVTCGIVSFMNEHKGGNVIYIVSCNGINSHIQEKLLQ